MQLLNMVDEVFCCNIYRCDYS